MENNQHYEVLIIGGSYAGLSAAMALGRSLRNVLVIDSGQSCNRPSPQAHNLITQDGEHPDKIRWIAKKQVLNYPSIQFYDGLATAGKKVAAGYEIETQNGDRLVGKKLIFATGLKDLLPKIAGFAECWGKSIIHCPYCHGYEVKHAKTGILGNGEYGFEFSKKINHWTKDLTLFTNGASTLTEEQGEQLRAHQIEIVSTAISHFEQVDGQIQQVVFKDGSQRPVSALYASPEFEQHCAIPEQLGCELTEHGQLKVDEAKKTNLPGVYACGDNSSPRAISAAIFSGTMAGVGINHDLIDENF